MMTTEITPSEPTGQQHIDAETKELYYQNAKAFFKPIREGLLEDAHIRSMKELDK